MDYHDLEENKTKLTEPINELSTTENLLMQEEDNLTLPLETPVLPLNSTSNRYRRSRFHSLNLNSDISTPYFTSNLSSSPVSQSNPKQKARDISKFDVVDEVGEEEVKVEDNKDDFGLFEEWLIENGTSFPSLFLKTYTDNVRGVHAKVHIGSYSNILYVPLKCIITDKMGKATDIGKIVFNPLNDVNLSTPNLIAVMLYMLTTKEDEDHFFQPYYKILPKNYSNFPIFWNEDKLKWLKGSTLLKDIEERKALMQNDYLEICRVYPPFTKYSLEEFLNMRTAVGSRNFGITIEGEKRTAMVPFADMLNHYRPRETSWTYENSKGGFTITSLTPIFPGDQVMDSYGKKCNSKFFLHYGFAVENNREENNKCQNEIAIKLKYTSLTNTEQKLIMLSGLFGIPIKNNVMIRKSFKLSMNYDDTSTTEILAFLRVKHATEKELSLLFSERHQYPGLYFSRTKDVAVYPISLENEVKVLKELYDVCTEKLTKYENSYAENESLLKSNKIQPFSDRRTALIIILSEQEICHFWKQVYLTLSPILEKNELELLDQLPKVTYVQKDIARYGKYLATKFRILNEIN